MSLLSARKLDNQTAAEIQASRKTGVLTNNRNDTYNRMLRSVARVNHAHEKRRETKHRDDSISEVSKKIEALTQARKENQEELKVLKAAKSQLSTKTKYKAESNSSGRVTSSKRSTTARKSAVPYPKGKCRGIVVFHCELYDDSFLAVASNPSALNIPVDVPFQVGPSMTEPSILTPFEKIPDTLPLPLPLNGNQFNPTGTSILEVKLWANSGTMFSSDDSRPLQPLCDITGDTNLLTQSTIPSSNSSSSAIDVSWDSNVYE